MKRTILYATASVVVAMLIGCSDGDISGTYYNSERGKSITLTEEGKFIHPQAAGDYSVEGNNVMISVPMVGGTKAKIDGNNLIFSDTSSIVGKKLSGTWTKTE